ncbi:MAG TPA: hypothetical protein VMW85_06570 [Methanomassiliicoccales archaeon]|nr:hypothetical protein [Methanomassiliicoccales archaeon]
MSVKGIRIIRQRNGKVIMRPGALHGVMIDDAAVLLTQILEELRLQNQYLYDIRTRVNALENSLKSESCGVVKVIESLPSKGV